MATVKTKFEIGATLYTLDSKYKIKEFEVKSIHVSIYEDSVSVLYSEKESDLELFMKPEHLCFSSKEELLRHIADSENA